MEYPTDGSSRILTAAAAHTSRPWRLCDVFGYMTLNDGSSGLFPDLYSYWMQKHATVCSVHSHHKQPASLMSLIYGTQYAKAVDIRVTTYRKDTKTNGALKRYAETNDLCF
jgi:hypothetical protein